MVTAAASRTSTRRRTPDTESRRASTSRSSSVCQLPWPRAPPSPLQRGEHNIERRGIAGKPPPRSARSGKLLCRRAAPETGRLCARRGGGLPGCRPASQTAPAGFLRVTSDVTSGRKYRSFPSNSAFSPKHPITLIRSDGRAAADLDLFEHSFECFQPVGLAGRLVPA